MLDGLLIIIAVLSFLSKLYVSMLIIYYKIKCKHSGLHMMTNYWFDYLPHSLFGLSLLFFSYYLTHLDITALGAVIALTGPFIFNMEILFYNKDTFYFLSFPFKKEQYSSIKKRDSFWIVSNEKHEKIIKFPPSKIKKLLFIVNKDAN
ncbi:MAG: hypothetical protein GXX10_02970 [Clostridiaceae bacterium]|nr:hypothetical protein [Clostridiaceae bacterium]